MTPLFQQRHYEWLANYAKHNLKPVQCVTLCNSLADTNPAFKRNIFLKACGLSFEVAFPDPRGPMPLELRQ